MQTWLYAIQQQLTQQILQNKLPHALIISGVKGAGFENVAQWLVSILLCQQTQLDNQNIVQACGQCKTCKLFASGNYPDHLTLSTDKASIGVDEVRNLSRFFEKTAHIGEAKTALLMQAERMTPSAANALLKTLEEPTSNSYIILTTNSAETLLPTIISRCQQIEIRPPVGENLIEACAVSNSQQQEQTSIKNNSHQNTGIFTNLSHYSELSDTDIAKTFALFSGHIKQYLYFQRERQELLKILVDDINAMRWFEKIIVDLMREQWCWNPTEVIEKNSQQVKLNPDQIWRIYRLVQKANIKLKTLVQVNRQLLSEKLLVDIISAMAKE